MGLSDSNPRKRQQADPADRLFAGIILHDAIRRGASRQELIDLAVRYKRLDVVERLIA